jgi:hypothetical protein
VSEVTAWKLTKDHHEKVRKEAEESANMIDDMRARKKMLRRVLRLFSHLAVRRGYTDAEAVSLADLYDFIDHLDEFSEQERTLATNEAANVAVCDNWLRNHPQPVK